MLGDGGWEIHVSFDAKKNKLKKSSIRNDILKNIVCVNDFFEWLQIQMHS